jgi:two-component system, NtrC family, response regulator AtoC
MCWTGAALRLRYTYGARRGSNLTLPNENVISPPEPDPQAASAGEPAARAPRPGDLLGSHPLLEVVRELSRRIAEVPYARVLITGESGTGKSQLARIIHEHSHTQGSFVVVNCAALPANLLESELFGHERGAFTDARAMKRGLIEVAHDGTLLFDEIDALPLELQAKLLLFLETHEIRRVGGTRSMPIRTRVIAATNEDLQRCVRDRRFRADLLYRLDVASIRMPALREMVSVIPELAERFVLESALELKRPLPLMTERSFEQLQHYSWPGNVRELRNLIERALIFFDHGELALTPPSMQQVEIEPGCHVPIGLSLAEVERRYIAATLEANAGVDLAQVANILNISRKTLWEKRRRYGL